MQSKSAKVQGVISVNGDEMTGDMMRRISGFVHQVQTRVTHSTIQHTETHARMQAGRHAGCVDCRCSLRVFSVQPVLTLPCFLNIAFKPCVAVGYTVSLSSLCCSLYAQEDVIMDTMTVREALMFAAELKLPKDMPYKDKVCQSRTHIYTSPLFCCLCMFACWHMHTCHSKWGPENLHVSVVCVCVCVRVCVYMCVCVCLQVRRVMAVTDMLNLRKALDNVVGSSLIKGISGGEKRRLSLGMEMM